jgi:hypothetical protein
MSRRFLLAALATAAGFGVAGNAAAANFGSAVIATYRSCAAVDSSTACDGNGPGQQILWPVGSPFHGVMTGPSVLTGGDGVSATGSFVVADGSSSASVTFGTPNSEPVFSGSTNSLNDVRLGSDGVAYYTYTNTGAVAVALSLSASIGYTSSSASPPSTGTANGQDLPGGAEYNAFVEIADPSYLAAQLSGPTSAAFGMGLSAGDAFNYDMIFGILAQADPATACGVSGIDAIGDSQGATTGGPGGTSVSSSACGGGGAYEVQPGHTVIILDGYQLISNRGGEIDPFTLTLTEAPPPNALSSAPEPASWLLMLTGVALVGGALRQRARLEKVPA